MLYQNRDFGITRGEAPTPRVYGLGLGMIILDEAFPGFPGDARNASAYPFPIQYEVVKGLKITDLYAEDKSYCLGPIMEAAKNLERIGCRAVTTECGYFSYFQTAVARELSIPVFMSSLMQVPMAQLAVGPDREVGIVFHGNEVTDKHLTEMGIIPGSNYKVYGSRDYPGSCEEFEHVWTEACKTDPPTMIYKKARAEFIAGIKNNFLAPNPKVAALVMCCSGLPTFCRALQREINMPIFSWGTMMEYIYSVVVHRDYYGHM